MATNDEIQNDTAAILEAAKKYGDAELHSVGDVGGKDVSVLSVPSSRTVQSVKKYLDEFMPAPDRKRGQATLTKLDSFIAHVNRTKDADSVIFANDNPAGPYLLAVYDYNKKDGGPRFGQHRAMYSFPVSDEWKKWNGAGEMDQQEFAAFIEERMLDIMDPAKAGDTMKEFAVNLAIELATPQRMMQLSRGLEVNVGQRVVNATSLSSGEGQLVFTEEHKDGGGAPLRVPGGFVIAIPVFKTGTVYQVGVRLRYRVRGGSITWHTDLYNTDRVFEDAIAGAVEDAGAATELPILYGMPENG